MATIAASPHAPTVLPPSMSAADDLDRLGLSRRSTLGVMVAETGGVLIDHGWVRMLGSTSARMGRSLLSWNNAQAIDRNRLILVGDDVLGGLFAIDGGAFGGKLGEAFYFAPDALRWEPLGRGYTDLVAFLAGSGLEQFYGPFRWPNWQSEVEEIDGGQGLSIYPFLWAEGAPIGERSRKPVPFAELVTLSAESLRQLEGSAGLFPS